MQPLLGERLTEQLADTREPGLTGQRARRSVRRDLVVFDLLRCRNQREIGG